MNFCHFKIGQGWSEDELLISAPLLDLLFLLIVKAVLEGADRKCRIVMVLLLPSLCSPVYISMTLAGMVQAAPAFVTLLEASSVAIYFLKTKQVLYFENSSVTLQGWLFLKNGLRQK